MFGLVSLQWQSSILKKEVFYFFRRYPHKALILDMRARSAKHLIVGRGLTRAVDAVVSSGGPVQSDRSFANAEVVDGLALLQPRTPSVSVLLFEMAG